MPPRSGLLDTIGRSDTDSLASSDTALNQADKHEITHSQCTNRITSPSHLRNQIRIATPQAEVELLESERDTLNKQIIHLRASVANLEEEVASLEKTIGEKDTQHQQMINQYEQIIMEKNQAHQELVEKLNATATAGNSWPISIVRSFIYSVSEGLRRALLD